MEIAEKSQPVHDEVMKESKQTSAFLNLFCIRLFLLAFWFYLSGPEKCWLQKVGLPNRRLRLSPLQIWPGLFKG